MSHSDGDPEREPESEAVPDGDPSAEPAVDDATDTDAGEDGGPGAEPAGDATETDTDIGAGSSSAPAGYAVPTEAGNDAETAWLRELAEAGELTPSAVKSMLALHDDRGGRAIEAVSEGRVKQYRDFTVVVGHEDEYVVEDGGCTCKDTAYNLDPENPHDRCWHVLSAAIAERIGEVDHHEMWYSEVREFL